MNFSSEEYKKTLSDYNENFKMKEWVVLQSNDLRFLTNDNPGFSLTFNQNIELLKMNPCFGDYNLSDNGLIIHVFPLAPEMCLYLRPFQWNEKTTQQELTGHLDRGGAARAPSPVPTRCLPGCKHFFAMPSHCSVNKRRRRGVEG